MQDGPLTERFTITHKDGQPVDPNARYFVLNLGKPDDRDWAALVHYIVACEATGYTELAESLRALLGLTARHICIPGQPYDGAKHKRASHPYAQRDGTCFEGCCDRWRCPVCGHDWLQELPQ